MKNYTCKSNLSGINNHMATRQVATRQVATRCSVSLHGVSPHGASWQVASCHGMMLRHGMMLLVLLLFISFSSFSQGRGTKWAKEGSSYYKIEKNEIVKYTLPENTGKVLITKQQLTPVDAKDPLKVSFYSFTPDESKVLLFTNTQKVWRLNTKGDYWVLDTKTNTLSRLGVKFPPSSLMFAKFSPDGLSVAYVFNNNIYVENISLHEIKPLTTDGTTTLINGTFDWVYEEEFFCRDGIRWSPDSKSMAYWQLDASSIKKFYMIDNTDSIYSRPIPIEYPKVGQNPSKCRVGVVDLATTKTTWMELPGDPEQHYIVRVEFIPGNGRLLIQQLNRKQNQSRLYIADPATGKTTLLQEESDKAWVDIYQPAGKYAIDFTNKFDWLPEYNSILWVSEKDGWRHLYQIPLDGKPEKLITKGNFDVNDLKYIDSKNGVVYYMASPDNATQNYLYRSKLDGKGNPELVTPAALKGTNDYSFSADGKYAIHTFSNHFTQPSREILSVADQKPTVEKEGIVARLDSLKRPTTTEFFKIKTVDGVEMDGWMTKPNNFDPTKKYPVVFYVYSEPATANVIDYFGVGRNGLYGGDMLEDGYIYISVDNRGTPVPKGNEWRKCIYRKIGQLNIHDQAMAAKEILKWNFIDTTRVAVWGWSGGGSATLNLMFQYPDIYQTGIAVAAVGNQLTYDNIYQERYMGLPQENLEDFINGSPITYAKNLKGNLLYIHGTGDDNVHYQNAEMLINELVKYNKMFQFMAYPNRTHNISEGEGTSQHLVKLYTTYLKEHCKPGAR